MYTAHTNPFTCSIESDYIPLHHLTNCDPSDPSTLMTVLQTEGYTDIKYIGGGYFTFNSLTYPSQPDTLIAYPNEEHNMTDYALMCLLTIALLSNDTKEIARLESLLSY